MRFGLLTQWYEPEPGPASLPAALARGLASRGHDVQVLTGYPNYPNGRIAEGYVQRRRVDEVSDGVMVRRVALYPSHDASLAKRMANYGSFAASATVSGLDALRDLDALWVNYSPVTIGLPMFVQRRLRRTPMVVHALDLWPDTLFASGFAGEGRRGRVARRMLDRWCGWMYDRAAVVAYISPGVGEVLTTRGVPPEKLAYAPMWADEELFTPASPAHDRSPWGLGPDTIALVYAGTLGNAQDLSTLIRSVAQVTDVDVRCLIAGSGTEEAALRELTVAERADRVQFLGRLDREAMKSLMEASDVHYVGLNSHPLAAMTMPSKVQSILASSRPIVGSLEGDAAGVVRRANGWTVAPGDVSGLVAAISAAARLGRDGLLRRGEQARATYEHEFAYARGVERIERLLVEAAARR